MQHKAIANILIVIFMAASTVTTFAQTLQMYSAGAFPHYAVGNEWSSRIYLNVYGHGGDPGQSYVTTCRYELKFYDSNFVERHKISFNKTSGPGGDNLVVIDVPNFNQGQLAYGPAELFSDCFSPIHTGELVFSQNVGTKTNDGVVVMSHDRSVYTNTAIIDLDNYTYGFALYNYANASKLITLKVRDNERNQWTKTLFTLAPKEQRIFVFTDELPELKDKKGLLRVKFWHNYDNPAGRLNDLKVLMLKFNPSGLFSTGVMYYVHQDLP